MALRVWLSVAVGCVLVVGAASAQQAYTSFGFKSQPDLIAPAFSDAEISGLMTTLDYLLAKPVEPNRWTAQATNDLWQFARRLQTGQLSASQETRVLAHLDAIARSRPEASAIVGPPRRMISTLTLGKKAPAISGIDLEGRPFSLDDYRHRVVLLMFSADWCGICRAQAPYERFLLDRYARAPLALLGVQTGPSRDVARQAQATSRTVTRAWWDAPSPGQNMGPIARAWNVEGLPATYLIDGDGIIRFVDLREEALLKAVRQLVDAQMDLDLKASSQAK
jgi:peroxiredoxin